MIDSKFIQQCPSFYPKNFNTKNSLFSNYELNSFSTNNNFNIHNNQKSFLNYQNDYFLINQEIYHFKKSEKSRFLNNEEEKENKSNLNKNSSQSEENDENKSTSSEDSQKKFSKINNNNNNNQIEKKNNNKKKKKKEKKIRFFKGFKERNGDWTCFYCKNLNFTFRQECNRCHRPKYVSDQGHENYFNSILQEINKMELKEGKKF
jgi:hypothetical protein